jgi:hypothetical protein
MSKKRFLAILLVLVIAIGTLPAATITAWARFTDELSPTPIAITKLDKEIFGEFKHSDETIWYSFTAPKGGKYQLVFNSTVWNDIKLYDSNGKFITGYSGGDNKKISADMDKGETYYYSVKCSEYSTGGTFLLFIKHIPKIESIDIIETNRPVLVEGIDGNWDKRTVWDEEAGENVEHTFFSYYWYDCFLYNLIIHVTFENGLTEDYNDYNSFREETGYSLHVQGGEFWQLGEQLVQMIAQNWDGSEVETNFTVLLLTKEEYFQTSRVLGFNEVFVATVADIAAKPFSFTAPQSGYYTFCHQNTGYSYGVRDSEFNYIDINVNEFYLDEGQTIYLRFSPTGIPADSNYYVSVRDRSDFNWEYDIVWAEKISKEIEIDDGYSAVFNTDDSESTLFQFTPEETNTYIFMVPENIHGSISLYDSNGKSVIGGAAGGVNTYSPDEYGIVHQLEAGKTYYYTLYHSRYRDVWAYTDIESGEGSWTKVLDKTTSETFTVNLEKRQDIKSINLAENNIPALYEGFNDAAWTNSSFYDYSQFLDFDVTFADNSKKRINGGVFYRCTGFDLYYDDLYQYDERGNLIGENPYWSVGTNTITLQLRKGIENLGINVNISFTVIAKNIWFPAAKKAATPLDFNQFVTVPAHNTPIVYRLAQIPSGELTLIDRPYTYPLGVFSESGIAGKESGFGGDDEHGYWGYTVPSNETLYVVIFPTEETATIAVKPYIPEDPNKLELGGDAAISLNSEKLYITGLSAGTAVEDFLKMFTNERIVIKDRQGKEIEAGKLVGTGTTVTLLDENGKETGDSYTVLVAGDIDGNGKVAASDARTALRASARLETLEGVFYDAANVLNTKALTAASARKMLRVSARLEAFN